MQSNFLLTFKDPRDRKDYQKARKSEILLMTTILFIQRVIFLTILVVNHFASDPNMGNYPDSRRILMTSSGLLVHLIMIILIVISDKEWILVIHGPIVILSYLNYLGNTHHSFGPDQMVTFVGQQMVITIGVAVLN